MMNHSLDDRDMGLKDDLIQSGAMAAHDFHDLHHPDYLEGSAIRLPTLLAANLNLINEDEWFLYAIRKYSILHIPNLYLAVQYSDLTNISYSIQRELFEDFHFPLGISNGTMLVGTPCPQIRPSMESEHAISAFAPYKRMERFLVGFSELKAIQERAEKHLHAL